MGEGKCEWERVSVGLYESERVSVKGSVCGVNKSAEGYEGWHK
jgi:hypothetical protein